VNSLHWSRCLSQMRRSGLLQASSFVCWKHHALPDGTMDFVVGGHPSRDLVGFLDVCAEEGVAFC
jgi:hypothetical protein